VKAPQKSVEKSPLKIDRLRKKKSVFSRRPGPFVICQCCGKTGAHVIFRYRFIYLKDKGAVTFKFEGWKLRPKGFHQRGVAVEIDTEPVRCLFRPAKPYGAAGFRGFC
jgi:hypothetical protein